HLGALTLTNAKFHLSNSEFRFDVAWNLGIFNAQLGATINSTILTVHAEGTILSLVTVKLDGSMNASGSYDLTGMQTVHLGALTLTNAKFHLSNAELRIE